MALCKGYIQYSSNNDYERYYAVAPNGQVWMSTGWFQRPESNFYTPGRPFIAVQEFDPIAEGLAFCGNYELPFAK